LARCTAPQNQARRACAQCAKKPHASGTEFAKRRATGREQIGKMNSTTALTDSALPLLGHARVSIQEIIRRHHGALIKFLRRRLSIADDAEDVAQETYIRMMRYEGSTELNSPTAMLFRIAVNVANDHGRAAVARHRKRHTEIDSVELTSEMPSAEREVL